MMRRIWIGLGIMLLGGTTALAQDAERCAAVISAAAASLATECAEIPLMSMCYGNGPVSVIYTEDMDDDVFTNPGDVLGLDQLDTMTAGGANLAEGEWGLVEFNLRLNYTDVGVAMFSVGSVRIENDGSRIADVASVSAPVTFPDGANIRSEPDPNADPIGVAYVGERIRATGILPDGTWVRVIDEDGVVGWITVTAFNQDALNPLEQVSIDDEVGYGSMQAFTLRTGGSGEGVCPNLPPNGVIIQTPDEDVETIRLRVNDTPVRIAPKSTVFLTAAQGDFLRVDVLEGVARVDGESVEASRVALLRSGEEITTEAYDYNNLTLVPIQALPRPIFLPIDFSTIINQPPRDGNPLAGIEAEDTCTIGATVAPANVREAPNPGARVRYVMQLNESAIPDARGRGGDGALWWRLAPDVWVSSNAVIAVGNCGTLPLAN